VDGFSITFLLFEVDIFDGSSPPFLFYIRKLIEKGYFGNEKKITKTNAFIPVSSRGAKKIRSLVIASPFQGSQ